MKSIDRSVLRILDVNLNRAREGLRVCEDIARLHWDNETLTHEIKRVRHHITQAVLTWPGAQEALLDARNAGDDCGTHIVEKDQNRRTLNDCFAANAQRVKESLRVLEELSEHCEANAPEVFRTLRFAWYEIEKKALLKITNSQDT